MKHTRRLFLVLAALLVAAPFGMAQEQKRDVSLFNLDKDGLAIDGYDPVAYFEEGGGKATKGSTNVTLRHRGVLYRFSSHENRALFEKRPERYEPMYGGWCAYAMTLDKRVDPSPKSFTVQDGKLYLFYKNLFNDNRGKWKKDPQGLKKKADASWKAYTEKG